jgi:hypothetical protein
MKPFSTSQPLPTYLGILAVDAMGFTGQPGAVHEAMSGQIPNLVHEAFDRSGQTSLWDDPPFFGPSGDGFAIGLPTECLPYIVDPFFAHMQAVLTAHNKNISRHEPQIRLRISLHVGPVAIDPARKAATGNGTARNDTHRLLDSVQIKAMLGSASPDVTHIVAILSHRVFQDVVADGYTALHPDQFVPVTAEVPGKNYSQQAWLFVPAPSGNLLVSGFPELDKPQPAEKPGQKAKDDRAGGAVGAINNFGQAAGVVNGDMTWGGGARRD